MTRASASGRVCKVSMSIIELQFESSLQLGLSPAAVGLILASWSVIYSVSSLLSGFLVDKVNRNQRLVSNQSLSCRSENCHELTR